MQENYQSYKKALIKLDIETLEDRREQLCLNFARKCVKNKKMNKMFPLNDKKHEMVTRDNEKYRVQFANTERLKNSSIIYMQGLLNQNEPD